MQSPIRSAPSLTVGALSLLAFHALPRSLQADDLANTLERVTPAVVWVEWETPPVTTAEGEAAVEKSYTSGAILSKDGIVVTVVGSPKSTATVHLDEERALKSKVVAVDRRGSLHLALLKVDASPLPHVGLAKDAPRVGESVVAVSAVGRDERVVARGIVSATDRSVDELGHNLLQSDVRVGPGSAGGPLLNEKGELLGLIAAYRQQNESAATFATPLTRLRTLLQHKDAPKRVTLRPGYLGVSLAEGVKPQQIIVSEVHAGTIAERVGLAPGDQIVKINEQIVLKAGDVVSAVTAQAAGEKAHLLVKRGDESFTLELRLTARPQPAPKDPKWDVLRGEWNVSRIVPGRWEILLQDGRRMRLTEVKPPSQSPPRRNPTTAKAATPTREQGRFTLQPGPTGPLTPWIQVARTGADKRIDKLTDQVKTLEAQIKKLTEQIEALRNDAK